MALQPNNRRTETPITLPAHSPTSWAPFRVQHWEASAGSPRSAKAPAARRGAQSPLGSPRTSARSPRLPPRLFGRSSPSPARRRSQTWGTRHSNHHQRTARVQPKSSPKISAAPRRAAKAAGRSPPTAWPSLPVPPRRGDAGALGELPPTRVPPWPLQPPPELQHVSRCQTNDNLILALMPSLR